jgi:predicted transcriptional regulator
MKSSKEIKKELHEYIDSINDDETLWMVHEEVIEYFKKNAVENKAEELTEVQIQEFNKIVKEMENGEFVTMDDFKKTMSKWITE